MTNDCATGLLCVGSNCRTPCTTDKQCTPVGLLCSATHGACVECVTDTQCTGTDVCRVGVCVAPVCVDGTAHCETNNLVTCVGGTYAAPAPCAPGTYCLESGGQASCVPVATGGASGSGGSASGGFLGTGGTVGSGGALATGGVTATGGSLGSGGLGSGGLGSGGLATGGLATGGLATGGLATGGLATGGLATGGLATGGFVSTGGWQGAGGSTGCSSGGRLDLWLVVDSSGSMGQAYDVATRWSIVTGGIQSFVDTTSGVGVGIVFFPVGNATASCTSDLDCNGGICTPLVPGFPQFGGICSGGGCSASSYTPSVPLTILPDTQNLIGSALTARAPGGGTPTVPALEGARLDALASAVTNPTGKTALVLITDGAPNDCSSTVTGVADVAAAALAGSPSIRTYVVTVALDPATMQPIATAGDTVAVGIPPEGTAAVTTALHQIVADACAR